MSQIISEDIAAVVVQNLRDREMPSGDLSRTLKTYPLLDYIRSKIRSDDLPIVRGMIEFSDEDVCRLGFSLAGQFSDQVEVRDYLESMWDRKDLPSDVRYELLSKLADDPELPREKHEEFFAFIIDNWDDWITAVENWLGGRGKVLSYCQSRVADHRFPQSKTWVYICCATASDDVGAAHQWVMTHVREDASPFTRRIAEEVLKRLERKRDSSS